MADSEQPAAAAAPAYTNVGELLREARVAKDLTVEQISTELRIEARQLTALEENRFEQIGPAVFVKGYIRQYGQRIGLDPRTLMEIYGRQTNVEDVQVRPSKPIKLRDERQITVWIVGALVLLLVAVGLAVWWWSGGGFDFKSISRAARSPSASAESVRAVVAESAPAEPAPAAAEETPSAQTANARTTAPVDGERSRAPVAAPPLTAVASAAPALTAAGSGFSRGPTPISLDLTFDSESWAEITDARGQRLFFELGTTGRHAVLRGEPPVSVTFGNGDAVRLIVDGERYAIPTQGRQGKLVRFSIASDQE